jgi:hypothetical protein
MKGTIYLDDAPGRALRSRCAAVRAGDVLYSAGAFSAGDPVYIAFRTADGSQYAVAKGVAVCDAGALALRIGPPLATPDPARDVSDDWIVVSERSIELLWRDMGRASV